MRSRCSLFLAIVIAWALCMSVAVHVPQGSAAPIDLHDGIMQPLGTCHDQEENSVPAAAKLPACCLVYCTNFSSIPAAPSEPARTIAFDDQPFTADTPPRAAGRDIHPDPHPPRA